MKYFSMFAGCGTGELGMEQAFNNQYESANEPDGQGRNWDANERKLSFRSANKSALCIGISEIDKYASAVHAHRFGVKNYGDATRLIRPDGTTDLPGFDFLIAGFPCQTFSIAGKRQGFDDARGTLFFEIARVLQTKRPTHFLLENVKGLLSHDGGKTMQTILGILAGLDYFVETVVLNSKNYGVPQNRERVFFIGHSANECRGEVLSFGNNDGKSKRQYGKDEYISACLDANYYKGNSNGFQGIARQTFAERSLQQVGTIGNDSEATRVIDTSGLARTIKNGGGMGSKTGLYQVPRGNNKGGVLDNDYSPTISKSSFEHNCLRIENSRIRRLTPNECELLQGMPLDHTKYGSFGGEVIEISDSQRYKMCGNSFTVNVIEAIVTEMINRGCLIK